MSRRGAGVDPETDTPAYFTVTDRPRRQPDELVEGRLFVAEDRLLCGAGGGALTSGYAGAVDAHSGSALRRLFGGAFDPQQFPVSEAHAREETITVPYASVADAELLSWDGSELPGASETFAVLIDTRAVRGSLVVQLGHGNRNRGSGRERHDRLVDLVRAHAADAGGDAEHPASEAGDGRDPTPDATAGPGSSSSTGGAAGDGGTGSGAAGGGGTGSGAAGGGGAGDAGAAGDDTVHCRDCGTAMSRSAAVCPACGVPNAARGDADGDDTVYCRDCGETMPRRAAVCPACGVPNAAREDPGGRGGQGGRGGRR